VQHGAAAGELRDGARKREEGLELEEPGRSGVLADEWRTRSQQCPQRHHRALTQMVDRRVRHLREALAQI
jgi:hypothetical protein